MHGFTDLEDRLLGADSAQALSASLASIRDIAAGVRASISAGLGRDDYAQAEKILAATRAAEHILLNTSNLKGA